VDRKRKPADERADEDKPLGRDDRVSLHPLGFEEAVRALYRSSRKPPAEKPSAEDPE
jgi:hypothetical protein